MWIGLSFGAYAYAYFLSSSSTLIRRIFEMLLGINDLYLLINRDGLAIEDNRE